uniref:Uncharacterized protein n=1 Tax=Ananas comosus var. bracteatus TaxID=296719 RepID=A0A6V7NSB3_ANACO|nr:unnamed protein product [Ananas comosus var. bracteatus]
MSDPEAISDISEYLIQFHVFGIEVVEDDLKRGFRGTKIKADRKITSLKQLQGHIWRTRFQNKELQEFVYDDVPEDLRRWHANGIKVTILVDLRDYISLWFYV